MRDFVRGIKRERTMMVRYESREGIIVESMM